MKYINSKASFILVLCYFFFQLGIQNGSAQSTNLQYYLPDEPYNPAILDPEAFYGFQPGDWHLSFDQVQSYLRYLTEKTDRLRYQEYAKSHEQKTLFQLLISSPENQENLLTIRQAHMDLTIPEKSKAVDKGSLPVVIQLAYTTHGNEQSGMHAAVFMAYYLAAGQSPSVQRMLQTSIIILDPCMNPDGTQRFITQVNSNRNVHVTSAPIQAEWNNSWPGGRGNHYMFDLNRDWISMTQPESRGRIQRFQEWMPNVLCDYHEMGSQETYFFQPGVPSRTNALTPTMNQELTKKIGQYHAKAFDENGSLYYTKENFDDYFYGKGSTYPDINGSVGILFEQASSRGISVQTQRGKLSFQQTIRNQITASFSSLAAAQEMRMELHDYKENFYLESAAQSAADPIRGWLMDLDSDQTRIARIVDLMQMHQIKVYRTKVPFSTGDQAFDTGSLYVPYQQRQYKLIKSLFEPVKSFTDSIFYDISAWNIPMSFRARHAAIPREKGLTNDELEWIDSESLSVKSQSVPYSQVGYVIPWKDYFSARALHLLTSENVQVLIAGEKSRFSGKTGPVEVMPGDLLIPATQIGIFEEQIHQKMQSIAQKTGLEIQSLLSGLALSGKDFGSPTHIPARTIKPLLLVGSGISTADAGEIWHHLDTEMGFPPQLVPAELWSSVNLDQYTHILLAGRPSITKEQTKTFSDWIRSGGNVISSNGAANSWLKDQGLIQLQDSNLFQKPVEKSYIPYHEIMKNNGAKQINGAIFQLKADGSHPLFYGIQASNVPIFHRGTQFYKLPENVQASPAVYADEYLLSGYVPNDLTRKPSGLPAIITHGLDKGRIITFFFQPLHRGQWPGTAKIWQNAFHFGHILPSSALQR